MGKGQTNHQSQAGTEVIVAPETSQLIEEQGWGLLPAVNLDKSGRGYVVRATDELLTEIVGNIVNFNFTRTHWDGPEDNQTMICFSRDGRTGMETATGLSRPCAGCPSLKNGCKLRSVLTILPQGWIFPIRIYLPTISTFAAHKIIQAMLARHGREAYYKTVKLGARMEKKDSKTYAVLTITPADNVEVDRNRVDEALMVIQLLKDYTARRQREDADATADLDPETAAASV